MRRDRDAALFLKGFVLLLGLVIIIPTLSKFLHYATVRLHCTHVYGSVTRTGHGQYLGSKPYVTFKDGKGDVYEVRSAVNYYFLFAPKRGDRLRVYYSASDPQSALVDNWVHYLLLPLVFLSIGFFLIYSVFVNSFKENST